MSEPNTIVCMRVEDIPVPPPNSVLRTCTACGELVFVSSTTLKLCADYKILCKPCFSKVRAKYDLNLEFNQVTRKEAEAWMGRKIPDKEVQDFLDNFEKKENS